LEWVAARQIVRASVVACTVQRAKSVVIGFRPHPDVVVEHGLRGGAAALVEDSLELLRTQDAENQEDDEHKEHGTSKLGQRL
jgi:hypothetical protein